MKQKVLLIATTIVIIIITILLIIACHPKDQTPEEEILAPTAEVYGNDASENLVPLTVEENIIINNQDVTDHDLSLHNDEMYTANEDYYPFKIMVTNMSGLADTELTDYAILSLEEYLHRYVTYYVEIPDMYWEAEYVDNSFQNDINFPSFLIKLHTPEEDITINCIYKNCDKRYYFESTLSGD